jgi:hypothetical protein
MERSRREPKKSAALPPSVQRGIESLAKGNEAAIASMLDVKGSPDTATITASLATCMAVSSLSVEALLARFFDEGMLSVYCSAKLGKSSKGNAATLASRIAREWAKPSFEPIAALAVAATAAAATNDEAPAPKKSKIGITPAVPAQTPPATLEAVLAKHGFKKPPGCKCFQAFAGSARGERLRLIDRMLGTACKDVEEIDTGMLESREVQQMSLAEFMRFRRTSENYETTYFSWCDKAFYTTEFGYGHRGGWCYKS